MCAGRGEGLIVGVRKFLGKEERGVGGAESQRILAGRTFRRWGLRCEWGNWAASEEYEGGVQEVLRGVERRK